MRGSILPGMIANAGTSLWHATLPDEERAPRPPLPGDVDADVAIVGAGYTGLWTAYALMHADPSLRVVICEPRSPASARRDATAVGARRSSRAAATQPNIAPAATGVIAMQRAMFATVDEIESVIEAEADRLRLGARRDDPCRDASRAPRSAAARARRTSCVRIRRGRLPLARTGRVAIGDRLYGGRAVLAAQCGENSAPRFGVQPITERDSSGSSQR